MNGVQTRFKCKLDVKRCKRFVFPPSSLLPRSNALKTKAIRYFQTDRTLTRIVSPPLQIKGRDYQVLYTKESKEVQVAIDLLSMVEHKSLTVEYKERKAFLTPFIPLLINPQKEHGLKGVSPFAKLLHLLVNFMDADGSGNTLNPDCIEDEIYKLFNELYPKE